MAIRTATIKATAVGANGAAAGSGSSRIAYSGLVRGVHVQYASTPNAGTVVTLKSRSPEQTIITITGNTSKWFRPLAVADGPTGATLTDIHTPMAVDDVLDMAIASGNAGEITLTLQIED